MTTEPTPTIPAPPNKLLKLWQTCFVRFTDIQSIQVDGIGVVTVTITLGPEKIQEFSYNFCDPIKAQEVAEWIVEEFEKSCISQQQYDNAKWQFRME